MKKVFILIGLLCFLLPLNTNANEEIEKKFSACNYIEANLEDTINIYKSQKGKIKNGAGKYIKSQDEFINYLSYGPRKIFLEYWAFDECKKITRTIAYNKIKSEKVFCKSSINQYFQDGETYRTLKDIKQDLDTNNKSTKYCGKHERISKEEYCSQTKMNFCKKTQPAIKYCKRDDSDIYAVYNKGCLHKYVPESLFFEYMNSSLFKNPNQNYNKYINFQAALKENLVTPSIKSKSLNIRDKYDASQINYTLKNKGYYELSKNSLFTEVNRHPLKRLYKEKHKVCLCNDAYERSILPFYNNQWIYVCNPDHEVFGLVEKNHIGNKISNFCPSNHSYEIEGEYEQQAIASSRNLFFEYFVKLSKQKEEGKLSENEFNKKWGVLGIVFNKVKNNSTTLNPISKPAF